MLNFVYYTPTKVLFGKGMEEKTGELIRQFGGTKVLVHYGSQSAVRSGLLDKVECTLRGAGLSYVLLGGAVPNPRLGKVREGIALGLKEKVDFVLAVGGGSVIDSAKAIAHGIQEPEKDIWELFARTRKPGACLPIGAVLTIAAAGSEMSSSCVITNEATGEKRSFRSDASRPRFAVMNPELTMTLPDWQTEAGCADIIMHTMERYFSGGGNMAVTDALSEALMRTVMKYAEILHTDPLNYEARAEVMWASSLSHNGLMECGTDGGDWATHGLEHELGGMFDVTHGAGLTALWGAWARYVVRDALPRFVRYARNVMDVEGGDGMTDEQIALEGIARTEAFFRRIGMPVTLRELGFVLTEEQIAWLAASCARGGNGKKGSAKVLYENDLAEIYHLAQG